jgi:hypothetical protein
MQKELRCFFRQEFLIHTWCCGSWAKTVTVTSSVAGAFSDYTITFQTKGAFNSQIDAGAQITYTFPAGTNCSTINGDATLVISGSGAGNGTSTIALGDLTIAATSVSFVTPVTIARKKTFKITFVNVTNPLAGTYTIRMSAPNTSGGTDSGTTAAYTIVAGVANKLAFTVQPTNTAANAVIFPAVKVAVQDNMGNTCITDTRPVTLTLNPVDPLGAGPWVVNAVNGIATFPNVLVKTAGTYTLVATSAPALTQATSSSFTVFTSTANRLAFSGSVVSQTAGQVLAGVTVKVTDSNGNDVSNLAVDITVAIGNNPGGGTLSTATSLTMTTPGAGLATVTFPDLKIDKVGSGYTLVFSSPGLLNATSNTFNITAAPATKLVFTVQPSDTTAGDATNTNPISPDVQVSVQDDFGNTLATHDTETVTMAIATNPASGTLAGTLTATIGAVTPGVAVFSNLNIDKAGTGYTLQATHTNTPLTSATSTAFNVLADLAVKPAFKVHPSNTQASAAIFPAVEVEMVDLFGNLDSGSTDTVALTIQTNPGGGTLSGTTSKAAVNGVASFTNLSINMAGTGYRLRATALAQTADSNLFNITVGTSSKLAFFVQPPAAPTAGALIAPAIQVEVQDSSGNRIATATDAITLAFGVNAGSGTLSGTKTRSAIAGVATFDDISIDKAANGYTLVATANLLLSATSNVFNVVAGGVDHLAVFGITSPLTAGASSDVTVEAHDALDNVVTSYAQTVTFASTDPLAVLPANYLFVAGDAGSHTFTAGVTLKTAGSRAVSASEVATPTITGSQSVTVNAGPASSLVVKNVSSPATAGVASNVTVEAQDGYGNVATSYLGTVSFSSNDSAAVLPLNYTFTGADAGTHTFTNGVTLNTAGAGKTVTANDGTFTGVQTVTVNLGGANKLKIKTGTWVTDPLASDTLTPVIQICDAGGNLVSDTRDVVATLTAGGGTLLGTTTVAAVAGEASFTDLAYRTAEPITITFTATGLTATSGNMTVHPGAVASLSMTAPATATAGVAFSVTVTALDAYGNTVVWYSGTGYTGTVSFTSSDAQAVLPANYTFLAGDNGVHTFTNAVTMKTAGSKTVTADDGPRDVTKTVAVSAAGADHLVISAQAAGGTNFNAYSAMTAFQVQILDAYDNLATGATNQIIAEKDGAATCGALQGTATINPIGGVATFNDLAFALPMGNGIVRFRANPALTGTPAEVTSNTYNIIGPAGDYLYMTQQPTSAGSVVRASVGGPVTITVYNGGAAKAIPPGPEDTITLSIAVDPVGGTTITAGGAEATVLGVATFNNLKLSNPGNGFVLQATSANGASSTTTAAFNVAPDVPVSLQRFQDPGGPATAGAALPTQPIIRVLDQWGNVCTQDNATVITAAGGAGETLAGNSVTVVGGIATFTTLNCQTATGALVLTFDDDTPPLPDLVAVTAPGIVVNPASASSLTLALEIAGNKTAGTAFNVTVTAKDQYNNVATGYTGTVSFTSSDAQAGLPASHAFLAGDNGVHTFSVTLKTVGAGTQTVTVSDGTRNSQITVNVDPAAAASLTLTAPASATANAAFSVTVEAKDAYGNRATAYAGKVTFSSGDLGGPVLPADYTFTGAGGDNGIHTFTNAVTLKTVGNQTVMVGQFGGGLVTDTKTVSVTAGGLDHFHVTVGTPQTAGAAANVIVEAVDSANNRVTSYTGTIVFSSDDPLAALPANYTFTGADSGIHTFTNGVTLKTAGNKFVLATDTGKTGQANVTVNAATPKALVLQAPPSNASVAGAVFPQQPVVKGRDQFGNVANLADGLDVYGLIAVGSSTLVGTVPVDAASGSGTFTDLAYLKAEQITIMFTCGSLTPVTSAPITISPGAASQLGFSQQPIDTPYDTAITPPVKVAVQDAYGNTITGATNNITVALTGTATLTGTLNKNAVAGEAAFGDLKIDKAGTGYKLVAVSGAWNVQSNAFSILDITPPVITSSIVAEPSSATTGQAVTFTIAATDNQAVTYTFNFGDGTTITGNTTGSATHTYTTAGTYTVVVTVYDVSGLNSFRTLTFSVNDPLPLLTPVSSDDICTGKSPVPAGAQQVSMKLSFAGSNKDAISVKTSILLNANFNPAGQEVVWQNGGIIGRTTLDAKGKSPSSSSVKVSIKYKKASKGGAFNGGPAIVTVALKNQDLSAIKLTGVSKLNAATVNKTGDAATIHCCVVLTGHGAYHGGQIPGMYKARLGKNASFKGKGQ